MVDEIEEVQITEHCTVFKRGDRWFVANFVSYAETPETGKHENEWRLSEKADHCPRDKTLGWFPTLEACRKYLVELFSR